MFHLREYINTRPMRFTSFCGIILIPRADRSYLFTRIKGERMEHILRQREWSQGRRIGGAPALTVEQKKSHSAYHTLAFILENYVDDDDDAPHTTWDKILKAHQGT
jgi:hypothetical protein